jgi:hypothetical protein
VTGGGAYALRSVDLETTPVQPPEVVTALALELAAGDPQPDPWWQAGIDEALGA